MNEEINVGDEIRIRYKKGLATVQGLVESICLLPYMEGVYSIKIEGIPQTFYTCYWSVDLVKRSSRNNEEVTKCME